MTIPAVHLIEVTSVKNILFCSILHPCNNFCTRSYTRVTIAELDLTPVRQCKWWKTVRSNHWVGSRKWQNWQYKNQPNCRVFVLSEIVYRAFSMTDWPWSLELPKSEWIFNFSWTEMGKEILSVAFCLEMCLSLGGTSQLFFATSETK